MKVLEKGTGQTGWAKEFACSGAGNGGGGCKAKLLVEAGDLFHTHHYDYGGGHDRYTTFKCAECGVLTDITHPAGVGTIPDTYADWLARRSAADPIEEAQLKSQITYPARF